MDYESLLKRIGEFGRYQRIMFLLLSLVAIPCALYNLGYMFWAARMDHWCYIPEMQHLTNLTHEEKMQLSVPMVVRGGVIKYSQCLMYKRDYANLTMKDVKSILLTNSSGVEQKECHSWTYDTSQYKSSIVSQWNLVCDRKWMISTSQSVFMAGKIAGCLLFGYLGDRFGRKKPLSLAIVLMVISSIVIIFSPNYPVFLLTRFIWSVMATATYMLAFVIGMEIVGPAWRVVAGTFFMIFWAVGYMAVCGLGYAIRDHFHLQLAISVPWVVLAVYALFVPESPRWLFVTGHQEQAKTLIKKIASCNGVKINEDIRIKVNTEAKTEKNMISLIKTGHMRWKTLILFYAWFANSFVYYGLSLNSNLVPNSNPYLNNFVSGAVEIPAYLLSVLTLMTLGRRWLFTASMILAGLSLLATIFIPTDSTVPLLIMAMLGKMAISASFNMLYLYTGELLPTVVRSVGLGSCSMVARIAGMVAVYSSDLADIYQGLPLIICGSIALSSGLLCTLLPETKNKPLPETIEEAERQLISLPCTRKSGEQSESEESITSEETFPEMNTLLPKEDVSTEKNTKPLGDITVFTDPQQTALQLQDSYKTKINT